MRVQDTEQWNSGRATRFAIRVPVRYRPEGRADWLGGSTENISRTGILMRVEELPEGQKKLEIAFTLAEKSDATRSTRVTCKAEVARVVSPAPGFSAAIGARILEYTMESHPKTGN